MTASTPTAEVQPPKSFDSLPLSDEVRRALSDMQYDEPMPVQTAVWEPAADGRDIVVQARTGTGKTTAFGLPIIDRLIYGQKPQVQSLILCPTRELALQVSRELDRLAAHKGIAIAAVYGGAAMGKQIEAIAAGAQIVVGTPGRVLDHLRRGTLDPSNIRALVLDESDEMLSMGFEKELTAIIERLPERRQTLLFSATIPPDIERMARSRLREPEFLILSGDQVGALEIRHFIYFVSENKMDALAKVLEVEDPESAIIFCNTREATQRVATTLARQGFEADWLSGDLSQDEREKVMKRTREGKLRFMVATDVAARGIDISHLTHVINYDFPQDPEGYVHRTGRTGRAGRTGTALSLVTPQEVGQLYMMRLAYKIRPIERQLPTSTEEKSRLETDIVHSLAETFVARSDARHLDLARRLLSHPDAERIVAGMLRDHLATNPEMEEVAQSRRRGKTPEPAVEKRDEQPRKRRKKRDGGDGRPREGRDERPPKGSGERPPEAGDGAPSTGGDERPSKERKPRKKREATKRRDTKSEEPSASGDGTDDEPDEPRRRRRTRNSKNQEPSASGDGTDEPDKPRRRRRKRTKTASTEGGGSATAGADDGPASGDSEAGTTAEAPPAPDEGASADTIELHVDAGSHHGVQARAIKGILADGGISAEQVHRVRVRERYCFVEVDRAVSESAIEVLTGATVGEHTIAAGVSKRSRG